MYNIAELHLRTKVLHGSILIVHLTQERRQEIGLFFSGYPNHATVTDTGNIAARTYCLDHMYWKVISVTVFGTLSGE